MPSCKSSDIYVKVAVYFELYLQLNKDSFVTVLGSYHQFLAYAITSSHRCVTFIIYKASRSSKNETAPELVSTLSLP